MKYKKATKTLKKVNKLLESIKLNKELNEMDRQLMLSYLMSLYENFRLEKETPKKVKKGSPIIKQIVSTEGKSKTPDNPVSETIQTPKVDVTPELVSESPTQQTHVIQQEQIEQPVHIEPVPTVIEEPQLSESISFIDEEVENLPEVEVPERNSTTISPEMEDLFDIPKPTEMSERLGHQPIHNLKASMGINERILMMNELFNSDKDMFDAVLKDLENQDSFSEAKEFLISGPATKYQWQEPARQKTAKNFIKLLSRYLQS